MKYLYLLLLTFCLSIPTSAQNNTVKVAGVVMDENGETLIGVNVIVKGTSIAAITDLDGRFRINNIPKGATVTFLSLIHI